MMETQVIDTQSAFLAILAVFSVLITTAGPVLIAWIAYKQGIMNKRQDAMLRIIDALEKNTNSKMDAVLGLTTQLAENRGNTQGRLEQRAEDAEVARTIT